LYQDQLTFLVGINGSGKTTVLSLLEGIYPPTEGTAIIYGKDLKLDIHAIRELYGIKLQSGVLFDYMSVQQNLEFFCELRGLTSSETAVEIQKYSDALNLRGVLQDLGRSLKYGDRLKLSIALALCGDSKIVLLDEPTWKMEKEDKEKVWALLDKEKRGRTILIATQSFEEANSYGDRIIIMADGEIKAVGTPEFLRKTFGIGYRLTCVKKEDCNPEQITEILRGFIPDIEIEMNSDDNLTYILNDSYLSSFAELFDCLENQFYSLRLSSFTVSQASLENVVMRY
jgi:ATP-binding cassette subfamily A (ABC1) protein 3